MLSSLLTSALKSGNSQIISRCLFASAVMVVASWGLPLAAMAQTANIQLTGVVQGKCSFSNVSPGILANPVPPILDSKAPGGVPGQVVLSCNQPANLQVSFPVPAATNPPAAPKFSGAISAPGFSIPLGNSAPIPGPGPFPI